MAFNEEIWDTITTCGPALRVALLEDDPQHFAYYYFSEYFTFATPPFHEDMFQDCVDLTTGKLNEAMWCVFREGAKTSIAKIALVTWWICYRKKQYINWDSQDKSNAEAALFDIVVTLQTNRRLIADFGQLYYKKRSRDAMMEAKMKRINSFITENGIKVEAFSTQESTRGRLFGNVRPDAFVLDDFENNKTKDSYPITHKVIEHIDELKSGLSNTGCVLYLCNYVTDEGSVAHVMEAVKRNPKGVLRFVPVADSLGNIAWPDKYVKTNAEAAMANKAISDPKLHKISLEARRASLGDAVYETEMMLNPGKSGDLVFDRIEMTIRKRNAIAPTREVAGFRTWATYNPMHRYGLGGDVSEGIGRDSSTTAIIDFTRKPAMLVATYKNDSIAPDVFAHEIARQGREFGECVAAPEVNSIGYATVSELSKIYPNVYIREAKDKTTGKMTKYYGWKTTSATKPDIIYGLKSAVESGELEIPDATVLDEMWFLRKGFMGVTKSDESMTRHFDLLMAVAIAWEMRHHAVMSKTDRDKLFRTSPVPPAGEWRP